MGVSSLQLVHLHRNRRYFVIKFQTWFCLSYFMNTNIKLYCIYQYFMSINSFFNTYLFSIQPPDYSDPWPTFARSTSLFLIMLFNNTVLRYFTTTLIYRQYTDIVEKTIMCTSFRNIYRKRAFGEIFCSTSQQVQMNYILTIYVYNVHVLCLSYNVKKPKIAAI